MKINTLLLVLMTCALAAYPITANGADCDTLFGKAQSLNMGRDRGGPGMAEDAHSGTVALTFGYKKCLPQGQP